VPVQERETAVAARRAAEAAEKERERSLRLAERLRKEEQARVPARAQPGVPNTPGFDLVLD